MSNPRDKLTPVKRAFTSDDQQGLGCLPSYVGNRAILLHHERRMRRGKTQNTKGEVIVPGEDRKAWQEP